MGARAEFGTAAYRYLLAVLSLNASVTNDTSDLVQTYAYSNGKIQLPCPIQISCPACSNFLNKAEIIVKWSRQVSGSSSISYS